jgi:hypothetical protein
MNLRSLVTKLLSGSTDEVVKRNNEMAQTVQLLSDSLASAGFEVIHGAPGALASSGGQMSLRRNGMVIRAINDRYRLMFDIASEIEPSRWYLFTIVRAVLERIPPADFREPTAEEVIAFVGQRSSELAAFFSAARWADSRGQLQEREQAQSAFMKELFKR